MTRIYKKSIFEKVYFRVSALIQPAARGGTGSLQMELPWLEGPAYQKGVNPILERGCAVLLLLLLLRHAQGISPLDSERGWTGELWSKTNLLNWKN